VRNPHRQYNRFQYVLSTGALLLCAALTSGCAKEEPTSRVVGGDPERGRLLGAGGDAGPSLQYMGRLSYIAGSIPNQPENMIRFLQNPPAVKPGTLMPALGISDDEARHMAAFMYTLR
jgi:cytochrome c